MPLSNSERQQIDQLFSPYCASKVPPDQRHRLQIGYRVRGNEVTLFESRPLQSNPEQWISNKIAQFCKESAAGDWRLFRFDGNGNWRAYTPLPRHRDLAVLLAAVENNETGEFWG